MNTRYMTLKLLPCDIACDFRVDQFGYTRFRIVSLTAKPHGFISP